VIGKGQTYPSVGLQGSPVGSTPPKTFPDNSLRTGLTTVHEYVVHTIVPGLRTDERCSAFPGRRLATLPPLRPTDETDPGVFAACVPACEQPIIANRRRPPWRPGCFRHPCPTTIP
jgi:hypothetical protein